MGNSAHFASCAEYKDVNAQDVSIGPMITEFRMDPRSCGDIGHRIKKGKCVYCKSTLMEVLEGV